MSMGSSNHSAPEFPRREVDVVVVGSGAAGLTAAVVLAAGGLSVAVIEKADKLGGTTAISLGAVWIPNNHLMGQVGQEDSVEEGLTYLRAVLGNLYDDELLRAYVQSGPEMLLEMERISEVRFYPLPLTDYQPSEPGAKIARTLVPVEYDGRKLGNMIRDVRNPLPGFAAFGSMQTDGQHVPKLTAPFASFGNFAFTLGRLGEFALGKVRHSKGTHMANGNALVGRLLKSALDLGVELHCSTPLRRVMMEGGRASGVEVLSEGRTLRIGARCAVVLATGGFGANTEMRARYMPLAEDHLSAQPAENVGDGVAAGEAAGGQIAPPNAANGIWAPCSAHRAADGSILSVYPHFGPDRAKPGVIIVDETGRRFANEAEPYQTFVNTMNEKSIRKAWFIGDRTALRKYGMGIAMPAPLPYRHLVRDGYLIEAANLAELAGRIGVPTDALTQTVTTFNAHAAQGRDPEFDKGGNIYDNALGDWTHMPSPNLRPLEAGPLYAIRLHPGDCSSVLGLETSIDAEVLDKDGKPVAGLFAVGLDQNSIMKGAYPGGGSSIGPAMTFAYRAARRIAGMQRQGSA
jgi:succinate dehydrogenase/fumarate reductase flavoprotein subunit